MIAILLSMVRGRWPRSLGVLLIAMATIAVAVAWPTFVAHADATMLATEIRHANAAEVVMSARNDVSANFGIPTPPAAESTASGSDTTASTPPTPGPNDPDWARQQTTVFRAPWFTTIYGTDIDVDTAFAAPGGSDKATIPIVLYRQDYCAHVVVVTGRCPVAVREVLLDTELAKRLEVGVGDALPLYGVKFTVDLWQPLKNFVTVTVVGTYRVPDENDPYWGTAGYFSAASGNRGDVMPILTQPGTVDLLPHSERREAVDAVLRPDGLSASDLPALRAQLDSDRFSGRIGSVSTSIPTMLKRVDADRAAIRAVVPGIAIPLILLGCFMVFLLVGHAVAVRRPEIAVLRLRGVTAGDRWWLAAGESLIAVVVAIPFGVVVGGPLARAIAALTVHGAPPAAVVSPEYGVLLGITVGLILLATCAAHVRPFFTVVTDLLRRVPDRAGGWRSVPLRAAIVVLAVAAIVQLRVQAGPPSGVTLVAPALVVTAIAVLLGRLVPPVAARLGRRAIGASRSGRSRVRLGLGLGAIGLARRPGAARLLAVEAVAVGMLGFTLSAAVAAAHDRAMFVRLDLGAPRVLSVGSATPAQLLHAVRAADPSGRYAMAAVAVPQSGSLGASVIAVDAARLGTVANWPAGSDPATVAGKLTVAGAHPVVLTATTLRMEATMDWASASPIHADMYAELQPIDGSAEVIADFGALSNGRHTYSTSVPGCANGCRVVALNLVPETESIALLVVTVHALGPSDASGARASG
ncbi:MAG TPA: ABC transporter permease, partial [Micromonosporaceae bacterium]